jgi:hypothetical protein
MGGDASEAGKEGLLAEPVLASPLGVNMGGKKERDPEENVRGLLALVAVAGLFLGP